MAPPGGSTHQSTQLAAYGTVTMTKGAMPVRTVPGPTDRVVVVGAGLGGLSTALHLAGAGREVTVLVRLPYPCGRAGCIAASGCLFDSGPTVLPMPNLLAATFDAVGERLDDWATLRRLE